MTDDQHHEGTPRGGSRWDPLPQGDYDDGATAFVNLPEGGIDALLDSPLAAPGHGYVPPQITVAPAATGTDPGAAWPAAATPVDGAQWHDPHAGQDMTGGDRFTYQSGASGPWEYQDGGAAEAAPPGMQQPPVPGHDVTGQWSIPVAGGDLPDESGEFTSSSLVEQWGGTPPPTLPGGAAAPWAATQSVGEPWGPGTAEQPADYGQVPGTAHGPGHPVPGQPYGEPDPAGQHLPHHGPDVPQDQPYAGQGEPYGQGQDGLGGQPAPGYEHAPVQQHIAGPTAQQHMAEQHTADQALSGQHAAEQALADQHAAEQGLAAEQAPPHPAGVYEAAPAAALPEPQPEEHAPVAAEVPEDVPTGADEAAENPADAAAEPVAAEETAPETAPETADDTPETAGTAAPETSGEPAPQDGAGADAEAAGAADAAAQPVTALHEDHPLASYVLRVNGTDRPVADAWIGESLLYVLRERLGLAGAKDGCSQGECGACNVQVDGRLVASCLVPGVTAAGSEVRTVEGLASDGRPSDVQRALARCGAVQCGFCVPGMAMTVHDLLEGNPAPTELETRQALCGNLCRCSGYRGVVNAVKEVVAEREAHRAADGAETDADGVRIPHQAGPGAGGVNNTAFGGPQPPGRGGPHDQSHGQDGGPA